MKAIGLYEYLPICNENALLDVTIDTPELRPHDLLVAVKAVAVNPVDTKVRAPKDKKEHTPKILGWDAAGEVVATGPEVTAFKPGDCVYYAGDITQPGCNSEFHRVDARIAGRKPQSLNFSEAAALPLTSITAWEGLFDRLGFCPNGGDKGKSVLIIGGAGGVGSIAIQLAAKVAGLNVIATASRQESADWCRAMGAHGVIDHYQPLQQQLAELGLQHTDAVFCLNNTDQHWSEMTQAVAPQGMICSIVETKEPVNLDLLKSKSAGFVWEFMFTRAMYQTDDMVEQQALLNRVAGLIDEGTLQTTLQQELSPVCAANLREAHALIEQGKTIGKIVLSGWE